MEVWNPILGTELYPYLHRFLLKLRGHSSAVSNSKDVFNEVFNLCRRAASDSTPGENIKVRYVDELKSRIGSGRQAELILCLSWVVLTVQEHPSYAISTFANELKTLIKYSTYYHQARRLAVKIRRSEHHLQTDFYVTQTPQPNMKIEIEGNPGTGNTFIEKLRTSILPLQRLSPSTTTLVKELYVPSFKSQVTMMTLNLKTQTKNQLQAAKRRKNWSILRWCVRKSLLGSVRCAHCSMMHGRLNFPRFGKISLTCKK